MSDDADLHTPRRLASWASGEIELHADTLEWLGNLPGPLCVLAMGDEAGEDLRLPKDADVLPLRVSHVWDERGEYFVVEYHEKVLCKDGMWRKTIWYPCRPKDKDDPDWYSHKTAEATAGHEAAESKALKHVDLLPQLSHLAEEWRWRRYAPSRCGLERRHAL